MSPLSITGTGSTGSIHVIWLLQGFHLLPGQHQLTASGDTDIALDDAKGIKVHYDSPAQQLRINVPVNSLPEQTLDLREKRPFYPPQSGLGMLVNYDIYVQKNQQTGSNTNAWSELRLFSPYGTLANTGIYRHNFSDNLSESQSGYIRYDTRWHYSDEVRILTYEAGDLVTRGLSWNNPVRIGGFQISKNFSVRPDIITYPLPQFSGSAAVPSTLDLYLDGNRAQSNQLNPGPFFRHDDSVRQRSRRSGRGDDRCPWTTGIDHTALLRHRRAAEKRTHGLCCQFRGLAATVWHCQFRLRQTGL